MGRKGFIMTKKTYRIPGISCSLCAMALQSLEDDLPGVKRVNASYRHQRLEVEFDEARLSEADLLAAIVQLGYDVEHDSRDGVSSVPK
jgi:P-type Cu+ transporter